MYQRSPHDSNLESEADSLQSRKWLDHFIWVLFAQKGITLLFSVILLLLSLALGASNRPHSNATELGSGILTVFDTLIRLLWLVPALFYARKHKRPSLPHRRLDVSLVLYFAALCFVGFIARIPGAMLFGNDANIEQMLSLSGWQLALQLFSGALIAPITEEYFCRELALRALAPYGKHAYLLVSSLLFAVLHANGSVLFAFSGGLFFAYLFYTTGKLRYTILLHILYNSLSFVLALLSEYASDNVYLAFAVVYLCFVLFFGAIAFGRCLYVLHKTRLCGCSVGWRPVRAAFSPLMIAFLICCALQYIITWIGGIL